jgi:2-amino-4-hydroxy-6-hydroxymethyldihydropteridine diphosphokinase
LQKVKSNLTKELLKKTEIGIVKKPDLLENRVKHSYLAIGSNLGNKINNINLAKFELEKNRIKIVKTSSYYLSNSWPDPLLPKYINVVIKVKTALNPLELLKYCKLIEKKLGRSKTKKNAPRTCDIDIIDYDKKVLNFIEENLFIPHPRMKMRSFVLLPLFEIDKKWKDPKSGKNIVNLVYSLSVKNLRSIKQI